VHHCTLSWGKGRGEKLNAQYLTSSQGGEGNQVCLSPLFPRGKEKLETRPAECRKRRGLNQRLSEGEGRGGLNKEISLTHKTSPLSNDKPLMGNSKIEGNREGMDRGQDQSVNEKTQKTGRRS